MKKLFLFFLLALGAMQGRAQLLVDADYNTTSGKIDVTFKNMSDCLTFIFCGERMPVPDAEMSYIELENGETLYPEICRCSLLPGDLFFLHPGEQWKLGYPVLTASFVRAFLLEISYWRANMPKEEWGKPVDYKMKNWRKYTLPRKSQVNLLRIIR